MKQDTSIGQVHSDVLMKQAGCAVERIAELLTDAVLVARARSHAELDAMPAAEQVCECLSA